MTNYKNRISHSRSLKTLFVIVEALVMLFTMTVLSGAAIFILAEDLAALKFIQQFFDNI